MRMNPDSSELFGRSSLINLSVEIVGHRFVVKLHGHWRALWANKPYLFDEQQVVRAADAEPADFGWAQVAETKELGPGIRRQPQGRTTGVLPRSRSPATVPELRSSGHQVG